MFFAQYLEYLCQIFRDGLERQLFLQTMLYIQVEENSESFSEIYTLFMLCYQSFFTIDIFTLLGDKTMKLPKLNPVEKGLNKNRHILCDCLLVYFLLAYITVILKL